MNNATNEMRRSQLIGMSSSTRRDFQILKKLANDEMMKKKYQKTSDKYDTLKRSFYSITQAAVDEGVITEDGNIRVDFYLNGQWIYFFTLNTDGEAYKSKLKRMDRKLLDDMKSQEKKKYTDRRVKGRSFK